MKQENQSADNKPYYLFNIIMRLWSFISDVRKKQFAFLLVLTIVSAFAEVVSLGAVIPFLGALISPGDIFSYPYVSDILAVYGIETAEQIVLPMTIIFCSAAMLAGGIRILLLWLATRLSYICGADLSLQIYQRTLYQPYNIHVSRNSSEVISGISSKVGDTTTMLYSIIALISSSV